MTFGEQLYLGLVVVAFVIFGITLAVVSSRTSRHMRRHAADQNAERDRSHLGKAA